MAAPTYTWEFVCDLFGDEVPKIVTLEASASLETKIGTLLIGDASGQLDEATTDVVKIIGLAAEATSSAASQGDPIKVALLAPGFVIKGTADTSAATLAGFNGKVGDLNTDGSLDVADASNGSLSVWRTEDSGLTVYCVVTVGALF